MSDSFQFKLTGLDSLLGKLDAVSKDMKYKGGRFALRKAANIVAAAAKANAGQIDDPATAEEIAKNVAVRWSGRTFKTTGSLMFRVGIMGGASFADKKPRTGLAGGDTRHWRFIEFGTSKARAKPFMRRAMTENIGAATDEFIRQYERSLDRAIKKAAKKATI